MGAIYVVRLVARDDRVLMEAENTGFRASSGDPDEVRSVRESFPTSVQWVHRDTRGYSYGASLVDPRTGEIVQGRVSLDSSRGRQAVRIFEGLFGTANLGKGTPDDPVRLALARLRQLAAHEVGHTLGFAHNFAGSTQDRTSVMDYPAPRIRVKAGALDATDA